MHNAPVDPLAAARAALDSARRRIAEEISGYPAPVSGCDAQFNHLLALRTRIDAARAALEAEVFVPTSRHPERA